MKKEKSLKIISLGGVGDVTKNMHVYETKDDILVVDCGIGFPEMEMLGVDILIPDVRYLKVKEKKIRGFIITQGHEDHFGALPYILPQFQGKIPVYAPKLVFGLIANKFREFNLLDSTELKLIDPEGGSIKLGRFEITAFRVNHSVPDTVGFIIQTPAGKVVHVSDFKFDLTPVDNKPFDIRRLVHRVNNDATILLSDCLGSLSEGYTQSEKDIEKEFDRLLAEAKAQVFITTLSSNISRMQQAINSSLRYNRRVIFLGRSVAENVRVARGLGFLHIPKDAILKVEKATGYPVDRLTYIIAGSYGQRNSALSRLAEGELKYVKVKKDAMVIFSADPSPPGVKDSVDAVVNKLTKLGADVHHYEIQENLHVSGHGLQGDLLMLARLVNPKYFIPIGGTSSMMRGYTKLMEKAGFRAEQVFELEEGEGVTLEGGVLSREEKRIKTVNVFVDGLGVGDVGTVVLRERQILAEGGVLVVAVPVSRKDFHLRGEIEVASRGFVFVKGSERLLGEIEKVALAVAEKHLPGRDLAKLKRELEEGIGKFIFKETERHPLVLPIISIV